MGLMYMTHDIDWLHPIHPLSVAKKLVGKKWLTWKQLTTHDVFLKKTEDMYATQRLSGIRSITLIGMQSFVHTFRTYGIRYSHQSSLLSELISLCKASGHEIGLHINPYDEVRVQATRFYIQAGNYPFYTRSHYFIPLSNATLNQLSEVGVGCDFSSGSNQTIGFPEKETGHKLTSVPTILSDNHFVRIADHNSIWNAFDSTLAALQRMPKQGALLFHPENFLAYPELDEIYAHAVERIVHSKLGFAQPKKL